MDVRHCIERTCRHRDAAAQLRFAMDALEILPSRTDCSYETTHHGLVIRGETESDLERPVALLQDIYGEQIGIGALTIRYRRRGDIIEEPHMGVRVLCPARYYETVKGDLDAHGAALLDTELAPPIGVLRATAPLARLLGYAQHFAELTEGSGREVLWFSHYAPTDTRELQAPPSVLSRAQ